MPKTTTGAAGAARRSHRADAIAAAFETCYLDYQYIFVEFLIDHLVDAGGAFKGDSQAMLVLAVLGQARLGAVRAASPADDAPPDVSPAAESTNASRIADITGIPRQTVRRKLEALAERGWIERDAEGAYRLVSTDGRSAARRDLSDTDRRAMQRVARLVADLESVIERHETLIGKSR
ncbi:MAG: helix-turn-helix domain-containing protein [Paracoccaceae bacterium]